MSSHKGSTLHGPWNVYITSRKQSGLLTPSLHGCHQPFFVAYNAQQSFLNEDFQNSCKPLETVHTAATATAVLGRAEHSTLLSLHRAASCRAAVGWVKCNPAVQLTSIWLWNHYRGLLHFAVVHWNCVPYSWVSTATHSLIQCSKSRNQTEWTSTGKNSISIHTVS